MRAFVRSYHEKTYSFVGTLCGGFIVASLAFAAPAFAAGELTAEAKRPLSAQAPRRAPPGAGRPAPALEQLIA